MAASNVFVDVVLNITPPPSARAAWQAQGPAPNITVQLKGGNTCQIDSANLLAPHHTKMLDMLRQSGTAVYIETAPGTDLVSNVLIPLAAKVAKVADAPTADRHEVHLEFSAARHFVRTTNPNYAALLNTLKSAEANATPVYVTETLKEPEIIDVRPAPAPAPFAGEAGMHQAASSPQPKRIPSGPVTLARAQSLFDMSNAQSCPTNASVPLCIPFLYPRDGCYARAHQMARLMIADGITPQKIWIHGSFDVETNNSPDCEVPWGFHVAPFVLVDLADGNPPSEMVIDPSLFSAPAPLTDWVTLIQGSGPTPNLERTDDTIYNYDIAGDEILDRTYELTESALAYFQQQLANVVGEFPPGPPYDYCSRKS